MNIREWDEGGNERDAERGETRGDVGWFGSRVSTQWLTQNHPTYHTGNPVPARRTTTTTTTTRPRTRRQREREREL